MTTKGKPTIYCDELWPDKCCDSCHEDYESGYQGSFAEYELERCHICITCSSCVREHDEAKDKEKVKQLAYAILDEREKEK